MPRAPRAPSCRAPSCRRLAGVVDVLEQTADVDAVFAQPLDRFGGDRRALPGRARQAVRLRELSSTFTLVGVTPLRVRACLRLVRLADLRDLRQPHARADERLDRFLRCLLVSEPFNL